MEPKNEQKVKPTLEEEARALRRDLRHSYISREFNLPTWKKAAYLGVIVLAIGGSVFLLLSSGSRQLLLSAAADSLGLFPDPSLQVFRLPPPPPKPAPSRILIDPGWSSPADDMILEPSDLAQPEQPEDRREAFVAPVKSSANQQAFQILQQSSDLVFRLVSNQLDTYEFKEWRPRQDRPPIFVLDLVAVHTSDQQERVFIWQVNLENQQVRALNQDARDLLVEFEQ